MLALLMVIYCRGMALLGQNWESAGNGIVSLTTVNGVVYAGTNGNGVLMRNGLTGLTLEALLELSGALLQLTPRSMQGLVVVYGRGTTLNGLR